MLMTESVVEWHSKEFHQKACCDLDFATAQKDKLIYKGPEELLRFTPDPATALELAERLYAESQAHGDRTMQPAVRPGALFLGGAKVVQKGRTWKYNRHLGAKRGFLTGLIVGVATALVLQRLLRAR
jgi:hypothetical protein